MTTKALLLHHLAVLAATLEQHGDDPQLVAELDRALAPTATLLEGWQVRPLMPTEIEADTQLCDDDVVTVHLDLTFEVPLDQYIGAPGAASLPRESLLDFLVDVAANVLSEADTTDLRMTVPR